MNDLTRTMHQREIRDYLEEISNNRIPYGTPHEIISSLQYISSDRVQRPIPMPHVERLMAFANTALMAGRTRLCHAIANLIVLPVE